MKKYSIIGYEHIHGVYRQAFTVRTDDFDHVASLVLDLVQVPDLARLKIWDTTDTMPELYGEWTRNGKSTTNKPLTSMAGVALPHH